jgi:hypothetical protein
MAKINWSHRKSTKSITASVIDLTNKTTEYDCEKFIEANHAIIEQLACSLSQHIAFTAAWLEYSKKDLNYMVKGVTKGFDKATLKNYKEQRKLRDRKSAA